MSLVAEPRALIDLYARWRIALAIALLGLVGVLAAIQFASLNTNRTTRAQVERSYKRDLLYERILSLHQDVETAQRGYSLTGRKEFLQPFDKALPQIGPTFDQAEAVIADPAGRKLIAELRTLSQAKVAHSRRVIETRRAGSAAESAELVSAGEGRRIMDRMRARIASLREAETRNQNRQLRAMTASDNRTLGWTVVIETLLLTLLLAAFAAYLGNVRRLKAVSRSTSDASRRQAAIFEAASDAMLVVDDDGRIEGLNPAAERLFARRRRELHGQPIEALFTDGQIFVAGRNDRRGIERVGSLYHAIGIRGDDSRFEAEMASSKVELEDEVLTLFVIRDATERNRVERMKNEFVSTVSHELRTPLTSIRGAIGLLDNNMGATASDSQKQLLAIAKSNSERLSRLIDDILDIEKIGSGRFQLEMQQLDLRDVVHDAEVHNRTYAADRRVRLMVTAQSEPLPVLGDSGRLLQALSNLISNAAKFSPEGGVVSVVAERHADVARVIVADQGPGIPAEFRPRLFERFSQVQGEAGRAGTGLGLAITKEIVERHGGLISYETSIGKGSRFWIDLPLVQKGRG